MCVFATFTSTGFAQFGGIPLRLEPEVATMLRKQELEKLRRWDEIKNDVNSGVPEQKDKLLNLLFSQGWVVYMDGTIMATSQTMTPRESLRFDSDPESSKRISGVWKFWYSKDGNENYGRNTNEKKSVFLGMDILGVLSLCNLSVNDFEKRYPGFDPRLAYRITKYEITELNQDKEPKDIWGHSHVFKKGMPFIQIEGESVDRPYDGRSCWSIRIYFVEQDNIFIGILEEKWALDNDESINKTRNLILVPFKIKDNSL